MELEETLYWLELIASSQQVPNDDAYVEWLWDEGRQLIAIFISIIRKAKRQK